MLEHGLVMDRQLLISSVIGHAEAQHGDVDIVDRETHGPLFRNTYADCARRSQRLADRAADIMKTVGEWISAIAVENAAMAHPAVAMAAVIGVKHPKWDERPLIFIVPKLGQTVDRQEILAFLAGRMPQRWVPDEVILLDALPMSGAGKVQKMELHKQYADVFKPQ